VGGPTVQESGCRRQGAGGRVQAQGAGGRCGIRAARCVCPLIACTTLQCALVEVGELRPVVAPLPVGAGRERSSSGFYAWFTLSRETDEKRIERDMRGVRG
jgi:hypothetical protein